MGATDPSGLGGLTPSYGYCKLKKDGVEAATDEHNWAPSCESNLDCREWDKADCPRYCEPNTKRCLNSCDSLSCDIGSGSLQCGPQFKWFLKNTISLSNLDENSLNTFLAENPSRLVCLNNHHRYGNYEEEKDFPNKNDYYMNKWKRFHIGACHVSCSASSDCTPFADILFGVGVGNWLRTCRFDSEGVGACGNPCKIDGEFCIPGNRNGVECCSGKCGSDGKCFTPKPLCATSSECPDFLGTLAANQSLLPFKSASILVATRERIVTGPPTGKNACLLEMLTDQAPAQRLAS